MNVSPVPVATYRLQFNRQFGFADARRLVPFLKTLGITHLYASPVFHARAGSLHGYDVVDPRELNPELGGREEFDRLAGSLRAHGMALLLDLVPNHMAAHWENPWWWDVLENGRASPWADVFDIDWEVAGGRLLLPVLGSPLEHVLKQGELHLAVSDRGFFVTYFDARFPLNPSSYPVLLDLLLKDVSVEGETDRGTKRTLSQLSSEYRSLSERLARSRTRVEECRRQEELLVRRLWEHYQGDASFKSFVDRGLTRFENARLLARLLAEQVYDLCYWKTATSRIGYRRFFDVTDLIGVRVEVPSVFDETHRLVRELAANDRIQAARVDHIDGLYDPAKYLKHLKACLTAQHAGRSLPVWVEKILAEDEELPGDWPVEGTSGYDALNSLNGVLVDPQGLKALRGIYARFVGDWTPWANIVYQQKKNVLEDLFGGELACLSQSLKHLAERAPGAKNLSLPALRRAVAESIACLPVYRTYIRGFRVSKTDRTLIEKALRESMRRRPRQDRKAWLFLKRVLLLKSRRERWLDFVRRWQQLTGPVMAKGFEDTALYRYHRLVSLNEVGGDPGGSYVSLDDFHERNRKRQRRWPLSLVATSTHDTKRSEDVRARITVLSELPDRWRAALNRWSRWNRDKRTVVSGKPVPGRREEVFFYQTLLGAWPLTPMKRHALHVFRERLCNYMIKAAREAKELTSWLEPNEPHERALIAFTEAVTDPGKSGRFLDDFQRFGEKVAFAGALNSLSQTLLKIAVPGVPDFYQGTVLWNLSLVDPDNRRPVDFARRLDALEQLPNLERGHLASALAPMLAHWKEGHMKLFTIHRALGFRNTEPELFVSGEYVPLQASGLRRRNVCAFARRREGIWAVAVVPRFTSQLTRGLRPPLGEPCWSKTNLSLPGSAPDRWENIFTGEILSTSRANKGHRIPLSAALRSWPVALLVGSPHR